jgi:beta-glucanase (GH16 family)
MQELPISRFMLINDYYKRIISAIMNKNIVSIVMRIYKASYLVFLVMLFLPAKLNAQCESLIWDDEFEAAEINTAKWTINVDDYGGGNNELQYYTDRPENIKIEDGKLVITALKENYLTREYTSAKISTKYKGDWRYGRIEASIKLPEGQGMWPAFWMLPTEQVYGGWPNSGEIDIMELVGHEPSTVYGTLHYGPPWEYTNGSYTLPSGKFSDDFHVFSIEWTPDSINWFVDDQLYSTKNADSVSHWLPFQEKFYVILNLAVGGNWPGSPDETTVFPQTMEVEYVRVYGDMSDQQITALDIAYPHAKGVRYSFSDIPGAAFNWSVPGGTSILSGQNTSQISVTWGCDTGTISLEVVDTACGTFNYGLPVTFPDIAISGEERVLQNEPDLLFTLPDLDSTDFSWVLPEGVSINGDANNDSILVTWGCDDGFVKVDVSNECGTYIDSMLIIVDKPLLVGPSYVSQFSTGVEYTVTEMPEASYDWFVPEGATIAGSDSSNSVSVNFGNIEGKVGVIITNTCGADTFSINVNLSDTVVLADFETTFINFVGWETGVDPMWIENPFKDGQNSSDHVGISFKTKVAWSGIYGDLGYNMNLSEHNRFSAKIYGPKAGSFLFKIEDVDAGIVPVGKDININSPVEVPQPYSEAGAWEELVFDFTGAETGVYDRITLFYDFGSTDTNTFYFDDIILLPADTAFISLSQDEDIVEGQEDGKHIIVTVSYNDFTENLTPGNWNFSNLPEGVTVGTISRVDRDTVILTLSGNSTEEYVANITDFTVTVSKDEFRDAEYDLTANKGIVFKAWSESGLKNKSENNIKVYPNPNNGDIRVQLPEQEYVNLLCFICSIDGRIIKSYEFNGYFAGYLIINDIRAGELLSKNNCLLNLNVYYT